MKYKRLLQHLTSPFAYRPAEIIRLRQCKADPQQNKVRVSMPMSLSFFQFSMLVTLLSSVIIIIVCKVSFSHSLLSTKPMRDISIM
mgnify:CR=1 FL=1